MELSLFPTSRLHRTMVFPYCVVVYVGSGNILFAMTSKIRWLDVQSVIGILRILFVDNAV